jgi:hypothetical protein
VSHRRTPGELSSTLDILIEYIIVESKRKDLAVNQLNTNHNTMILLIVILLVAVIAAIGSLALFTLLV